MRVFILCNGTDAGWNNHLGVPKQLVSIDGEAILDRTIRQLKEHSVEPVLVTNREDLIRPGVRVLKPPEQPRYGQSVPPGLATAPLWSYRESNVLLLGDVRYSDTAIKWILTPRARWTFFCRWGPLNADGSPNGGEGWAIQFPPEYAPKYLKVLRSLARKALPGQHFWQQYRLMNGKPHNEHGIFERHVVIDDETEDFDYPEHLAAWLARYPQHKLR